MYIKPTLSYYENSGQQCARRQDFLLLIQPKIDIKNPYPDKNPPIKALVRKVALRQLGHFMMGFARVYRHRVTVSGSYGGDGLPCHVPHEVYDRAQVVLPDELYQAWANGGGWNSAGSEAEAMREWALENLKELKK